MKTFKQWEAQKSRNKRFGIAALVLVAGYALLCVILRPYFAVRPSCGAPCPEGIGCDVLGFAFQALPAKRVKGVFPGIWYKAELFNRSCLRLEDVHIDSFYSYDADYSAKGYQLWLKIFDSSGKEVHRIYPHPDGGISWNYPGANGSEEFNKGTIHPYQNDKTYLDRLIAAGWKTKDGATVLTPGASFATIPSAVSPYRLASTSERTPDGGVADGIGRIPATSRETFSTPPDGYRWIEGYALPPGRYTITSGYIAPFLTEKMHPRWDRIPGWLQTLLFPAAPYRQMEMKEVELSAPDTIIEVPR